MAGKIDERGYMNAMNKKGFNSSRALSELYANALDAGAKKIVAKIVDKFIWIIDDGQGMDISGHENLWDAQRENHSDDNSTGVSGFGAKPSTKQLSKNTTVSYYSKTKDGNYCKSVTPWGKMVSEGKYTGMIKITEMNSDEIDKFVKLCHGKSGTIIQFEYNYFIRDEILKQFNDPM